MANDSKNLTSLMLSANDAAALLGIKRTLFYSLHSTGRLGPVPINLGRRTLWRRRELEAWVAAGCPSREAWLQEERSVCHASI